MNDQGETRVAQGTQDADGQTGSMQDRFIDWFRTAMWGLLFGLRALVITMVFAAVVVGPVILTAGGVITGKSVGQTTAWVWLAMNGTAPKMGAAVITLLPWGGGGGCMAVHVYCRTFVSEKTVEAKSRVDYRWGNWRSELFFNGHVCRSNLHFR